MLLLLLWRRHRLRLNYCSVPKEEEVEEECILAFMLKENSRYVHSRNRKAYHRTLCTLERRRRQRNIPTSALLHPHQSAWRKLYASGNDTAMITFTGFDNRAFHILNDEFQTLYNEFTPHSSDGIIRRKGRRGRKRLLFPRIKDRIIDMGI